ncbi:MAG TPA: hypothetical protein PK771_16240, partial [Spirochaetota bacterium]|nr:hypothetical protein [Spirochaetota bacterium]
KLADQLLKKDKEAKIQQEDTSISEGVVSYPELAEIFYQKQDYISSLFYYSHIKEISKEKDVTDRIEKIKEILRYKNAFMTDNEFRQFLDQKLRDIQDIYSMKKRAEVYLSENEIQKALFVYNDILQMNSSLRDTVLDQNNSYQELLKLGTDISDIKNSKIFYGKNDIVFMIKDNIMLSVGFITKVLNMDTLENIFYLYDVKLYKFDEKFNIATIIYSPYGRSKGKDAFTLYSYDINDREIEYFPFPIVLQESEFNKITNRLNSSDKEIFMNYYELKDGQYKIERNLDEIEKIKIGKIIKESKLNILTLLDKEKKRTLDYIMNFPVDINIIYNFSYDYNKALNFSLYKLFSLK